VDHEVVPLDTAQGADPAAGDHRTENTRVVAPGAHVVPQPGGGGPQAVGGAYRLVDLTADAALTVVGHLAIVGFDNLDVTKIFSPNLSSVSQPFTLLGEAAAEIAYKHITKTSIGYKQTILPVKLYTRESSLKQR